MKYIVKVYPSYSLAPKQRYLNVFLLNFSQEVKYPRNQFSQQENKPRCVKYLTCKEILNPLLSTLSVNCKNLEALV